MSGKKYQHIIEGAKTLHKVARNIRILGHISWPLTIREEFFSNKAEKLPEPVYPDFDATEIISITGKVIAQLDQDDPMDQWLSRQAQSIQSSARLLAATGTSDFLEFSQQLYGKPTDTVTDGKNRVLDLAHRFQESLDYFQRAAGHTIELPNYDAETAAEKIKIAIEDKFKGDMPIIEVVPNLSANATASARKIRLRGDAGFSQRFINQLIQHEAYIHYATSANGRTQTELPILAISHPGTTRTQEGLAVFSEFITGVMDTSRLQKLADRVIATQMSIEGADFIEIFRFFSEGQEDQIQAFENTRRVFRGGLISGGAPFTKDIVYLDGLIRVHNFLRAMVTMERIDTLPYLFCGKLDLNDIPIICELAREGICKAPTYLPDWVEDNEFLLSYLAYSSFLNHIDMSKVQDHYQALLQSACRTC